MHHSLPNASPALISDKDADLVPDLANIPSYTDLPWEIYKQVRSLSRNYDAVFGNEGLVKKMDTMVCTLSKYKQPFGLPQSETSAFLRNSKITVPEDNIVGDMAGVILVKKTPKVREEAMEFRDYEKRSNNITYDQIWKLAQIAANEHAYINGVVVIATGIEKAPVLKKALELKIVNTLLCDHELAEEVLG